MFNTTSILGELSQAFITIAIGIFVIAALAQCASRMTTSPSSRRNLWRFCLIGVIAFGISECTGITPAVLQLLVADSDEAAVTEIADDIRNPNSAIQASNAPMNHLPFDGPSGGKAPATLPSISPHETFPTPVRGEIDVTTSGPPIAAGFDARTHGAETDVIVAAQLPRTTKSAVAVSLPLALFFVIAVALVARIAWKQLRLIAFYRRTRFVEDEELRCRLQQLRSQLRIRRRIKLLRSENTMSPVTFGMVFPVIAIPSEFSNQFSHEQQDTMLAHELAHVAAWDSGWQLITSVACALLWWHPGAWWCRRQLSAASEAAADEASLLVPGGPQALAICLVAIGRQLAQPRRLAWLSVEGGGLRSGLAQRVKTLLAMPQRSWRAPRRGRLLISGTALMMILVVLAVSSTVWARPRHPLSRGDTSMNVLKQHWRKSLAATAIATILIPVVGSVADDEEKKDRPRAERGEGDGDRERDERRERDSDRKREGDRERDRDQARRDGDRKRELGPDAAHYYERAVKEIRSAIEAGKITPEQGREKLAVLRKKLVDRARGDNDRRDHKHGDHQHDVHPEVRQKVERLKAQQRELEEKAKATYARLKEVPEGNEGQIKELKHVLEEIKEHHGKIGHQIQEIVQHHRRDGDRRPDREHERPREGGNDLERRIHHLRVAAENLKAAGLHDEANHVTQQAERIIQEHRNRKGEDRRPESRADRPDRPDREHAGGGQDEVRRLRGEVGRLQRELHEIKSFIREIVNDREEGERDERRRDRDEDDGERERRERDRDDDEGEREDEE
jgi:beta-lactamase regulating signal transducer with metallopeptidase domain